MVSYGVGFVVSDAVSSNLKLDFHQQENLKSQLAKPDISLGLHLACIRPRITARFNAKQTCIYVYIYIYIYI